jgi:outer membrane protein assembly factor BamB
MKRWFTKKRVLSLGAALLLLMVLAGTGFALIPRPTLKWSYQPEPYRLTHFSPIVSNDLVFTFFEPGPIDYNTISALDTHSGEVRWSTHIEGFTDKAPALADGLLYILAEPPRDNTTLHALDAASGREQWSYQQVNLSAFTIANGVVYIYSDDGTLYALNALSGHLLWSIAIGGGAIFSAPVVANHLVYIAAENAASTASIVYAVDAASGRVSWSAVEPTRGIDQLAVANGVVYIAEADGAAWIFALDAFSGKTRWSMQLGAVEANFYAEFAVSFQVGDGMVYIIYDELDPNSPTMESTVLHALDASTGQEVWKTQTVSDEPMIADGMVYLYTAVGMLSALDARSGRQKWTHQGDFFDIGTSVAPEPALADGTIYVRAAVRFDDTLYALDAISGSERWSYHINGYFLTPFVVSQGMVYGWVDKSFNSMVQAIQPPGGPPGFAM